MDIMGKLKSLQCLAEGINKSWEENESVEWSEAEQLVQEFQKIPSHLLNRMPGVRDILYYAQNNEDWDSGEVANWPVIIKEELVSIQKLS